MLSIHCFLSNVIYVMPSRSMRRCTPASLLLLSTHFTRAVVEAAKCRAMFSALLPSPEANIAILYISAVVLFVLQR